MEALKGWKEVYPLCHVVAIRSADLPSMHLACASIAQQMRLKLVDRLHFCSEESRCTLYHYMLSGHMLLIVVKSNRVWKVNVIHRRVGNSRSRPHLISSCLVSLEVLLHLLPKPHHHSTFEG